MNWLVKAGTTMAAIAEEAVKEYEKKKFWGRYYYAGYKALASRPDRVGGASRNEINCGNNPTADGLEEWPNE